MINFLQAELETCTVIFTGVCPWAPDTKLPHQPVATKQKATHTGASSNQLNAECPCIHVQLMKTFDKLLSQCHSDICSMNTLTRKLFSVVLESNGISALTAQAHRARIQLVWPAKHQLATHFDNREHWRTTVLIGYLRYNAMSQADRVQYVALQHSLLVRTA